MLARFNIKNGMLDLSKTPIADASAQVPHGTLRSTDTNLGLWLLEALFWCALALFVVFAKLFSVCRHLLVTGQYMLGILIVLSLGAFLLSLARDIVKRKLSPVTVALLAVWMVISITISVMFWSEAPMWGAQLFE